MKPDRAVNTIEKSVTQDKNFRYTIISYVAILAIFLNLNGFQSPLIGLLASILYFLINAVFLENALFQQEKAFFRLIFGFLSMIMLLGFVGWVIMIIYDLSPVRFTLVLLITATISSLANRRVKHRNALI